MNKFAYYVMGAIWIFIICLAAGIVVTVLEALWHV